MDTKVWDLPNRVRTRAEVEKEVAPGFSPELAALHPAAACCAQEPPRRKAAAAKKEQRLRALEQGCLSQCRSSERERESRLV